MSYSYIEEQFNYYLRQPFESLRIAYLQREIDWEDAIAVHQKLIERLGIEDPDGPLDKNASWVRSSWCMGG